MKMEEGASGIEFIREMFSNLLIQASTNQSMVAFRLRSHSVELKTDERGEMICSLLRKPM
jgi:hypothetical protein